MRACLEGDEGALIVVVEAAAQHAALRAQLLVGAVEEEVLLLVGLPEAAAQLVRDAVVRLLAGQAQLDLHLSTTLRTCRKLPAAVHQQDLLTACK